MPEVITDRPATKRQTGSTLRRTETKADKVIKLLRRKNGATIAELQKATGWQAHSVRGLLSGTLRKRMGINVEGQTVSKGTRRYRVAKGKASR